LCLAALVSLRQNLNGMHGMLQIMPIVYVTHTTTRIFMDLVPYEIKAYLGEVGDYIADYFS
jgi:hypothetical protein